jgi:RimJ/RimL family protein N-acetyltransferase
VDRHPIKVARQIRTMLDDVMWHRGIYRAQANIHSRFDRAIRLAEWLGFENEGLMRRFGAEGADYFRYAKVSKARN